MIVNKLVTQMSFAGMKQSYAMADKLLQRMKGQAQRQTSDMERAHARNARRSAEHWQKSAAQASKAYKGAFAAMSAFKLPALGMGGMIPGLAGAAGVGMLGKGILDAGKEYENMLASLGTAMGSDAAGAKAFKQIEKFARTTPYELQEVADAFVKLKNFGLDPSEAALKSYGNTAGALGKPLTQVIEAVADAATGGGFERLRELGIKTKQQGDKVSFTFKGMTKTVGNNAKEIQAYLMSLGNTNFAGGMDKQAATIGGILSNLSDNFQAIGRSIWTAGVGANAKQFSKWLVKTTDQIIPWVEKHLPRMIDQTVKLGQQGLKVVNAAWKQMDMILPAVAAGLLGVGAAMAYMKGIQLYAALQTMIIGLRAMTVAELATAAAGWLANAAVMAIPIAIGVAVAAVAWFGYQVYKYMTEGTAGIEGLTARFPLLSNAVIWVGDRFKEWWPTIKYVAELVGKVLVGAFNLLAAVARFFFEGLIKPFFAYWLGEIGKVGAAFKTIYDFAMPYLTKAFDNFKISVDALFTGFRTGFAFLMEKFPWLKTIVETIGKAMTNGWGAGFASGGGDGSDPSALSAAGPGGMGLAKTAMDFITSGKGDALAKRDSTGLFQQGVACNYLVNQLVAATGASKALQAQMTNRVPDTFRNLLKSGMAEIVPFSQIKPGDLAASSGYNHIGVIGMNNKLIHASNSRGSQIGRGQRPVIDNNYMGASGHYLRIKPQYLNQGAGGGTTINQTINVPGGDPAKTQRAVTNGTNRALNNGTTSNRPSVVP